MVSYHCGVSSVQAVSEQLDRHYYCKQLLISGTVSALSVAEGLGGVRDYSFNNSSSFVLVLFQHSSYPDIAGICAESEMSFSDGIG